MATQPRRKTVPARAKRPAKRRGSAGRGSSPKAQSRAAGMFLPFFLSFCILICLGAVGVLGYRSVTASNFFDVKKIDIYGNQRSSKTDVERIVSTQTERSGTWNADLTDIKAKVEQLPFVKNAAVSRVLPSGVRVYVTEYVPQAIVKTAAGDVLVDADGKVLAPAGAKEDNLPFSLIGWDDAKTEKAIKDNADRVKMYQKMLGEWKQFDLALRVKNVDLSDMREPKAITEDSGLKVSIALGKDNFAENLKKGINAIVGKGDTFEAVDLVGANMILAPRKTPQPEVKTVKPEAKTNKPQPEKKTVKAGKP